MLRKLILFPVVIIALLSAGLFYQHSSYEDKLQQWQHNCEGLQATLSQHDSMHAIAIAHADSIISADSNTISLHHIAAAQLQIELNNFVGVACKNLDNLKK